VLFGITCPDNKATQFAILSVGSLICSIGFSALQEGVTRVPVWLKVVCKTSWQCFASRV